MASKDSMKKQASKPRPVATTFKKMVNTQTPERKKAASEMSGLAGRIAAVNEENRQLKKILKDNNVKWNLNRVVAVKSEAEKNTRKTFK